MAHAQPADLGSRVPTNHISALATTPVLIDEFYLTHGHIKSEPVPLLPVIRSLLYDAESIEVQADSWLVWTRVY